jgi:hypothetical protein
VEFVVNDFPCQSFIQLLYASPSPPRAGAIGQTVSDVPNGPSLTPSQVRLICSQILKYEYDFSFSKYMEHFTFLNKVLFILTAYVV